MSVLIVTSVGDLVVDLYSGLCPLAVNNFVKLCKMKYYNGCLFYKVEKDFLAQSGDPTGTGTGGDSVYKFLYGDQARFFNEEIHPKLRHSKIGTVAMASAGKNCNASQFYITLRHDLDYLDDKHTVFGLVSEGLDTLMKINESYVDDNGRPLKDIRIKHTYVLYGDRFKDPPQLLVPENSPIGKPKDEIAEERLEETLVDSVELENMICSKEAHANAVILESVGDIPDAEVKPPDNVLFVCRLNPVTQDEDLYTIFSRFGTVASAEVIRDYKTGDSLCYAFVEFEAKEACERAYFKMDNCLIDDQRIHVDFSQSVSKLWGQFRQGIRNANKDKNTQRGGNNRPRYYDLVFDKDGANADKQDGRNVDRSKFQKLNNWRAELPPKGDRDRINRENPRSNKKGGRQVKEVDRSRGCWRHDDHSNSDRSGDRSSSRHDNGDYSKPQSRSIDRDDDEDYKQRRSGVGRYDRDKSDGEWHRREDDDREKSDHH